MKSSDKNNIHTHVAKVLRAIPQGYSRKFSPEAIGCFILKCYLMQDVESHFYLIQQI